MYKFALKHTAVKRVLPACPPLTGVIAPPSPCECMPTCGSSMSKAGVGGEGRDPRQNHHWVQDGWDPHWERDLWQKRWKVVWKDMNMSGACDYRYVWSLTVTFCDINTSREQLFSVTHEAKYEMRTSRRGREKIFVDVYINKLPLYGNNQVL